MIFTLRKKILAGLMVLAGMAAPCIQAQKYTSFTPGEEWLDNNNTHINAHGGNILKYKGTYYWYGENRPVRGFTTEAGVEVFSSKDLMNWTDRGVALAVTHTQGDDIEKGCIMERPKVVYNKKTKKFVMLFHLELKHRGYEAARVGFAVSDTPTGPFTYIRSLRPNAGIWPANFTSEDVAQALRLKEEDTPDWWTPEWRTAVEKGLYTKRDFNGGQMSRDMTVYIDEDGKAYHITSSEENLTLMLHELTDDYLGYTGKYIRIAAGGQNEAPTLLHRNGKYWLICSGCTGWAPNEARMFTATSLWGPWTQVASPFTGEGAKKSFGTQGTYIYKEEKTGTYIYMADIWNPEHLAYSRHVWLPMEFAEDGTPILRRVKEWTLMGKNHKK
jgi:hypothetical protein